MAEARVLMIIDQFHPLVGGAERQALLLALRLRARACQVSVLTRRVSGDLPADDVVEGLVVHRVPGRAGGKVGKLVGLAGASWFLARRAREFDVVHCHGMNPVEWSAGLANVLHKKPYIVKIVTPDFLRFTSQRVRTGLALRMAQAGAPLLRQLRLGFFRRAHRVIGLTEDIVDALRAAGIDQAACIPNGVDVAAFAPLAPADRRATRLRLGLPEDGLVFVFAGRLVGGKNVLLLARAWARVHAPGSPHRLVILGAGGTDPLSEEPELRQLISELRLEDSVVLAGQVADVRPHLQSSDVFVLPSLFEGLSNALLEAMACGLAIIASDIPANRGLLAGANGPDAGLLFSPTDSVALEHHLRALLAAPDRVRTLGRAARDRVERTLSIDAVADKYLELYRTAMGAAG
jgi:glycosyltransferase involved in cell wall biosynthesis